MIKKYKYYLLLILGFIILAVVNLTKPKEINWYPSFSKHDKIPYGNFVLFKCLPDIFPEDLINVSDVPLYNYLKEQQPKDANYLIINDDFQPDQLDLEYLLYWVSEGNDVFISAKYFGIKLRDTLEFELDVMLDFDWDILAADSIDLTLQISEVSNSNFNFTERNYAWYFSEYDSTKTDVLGKIGENYVNFTRTSFGKGNFYLHSTPYALTNYHLLKDNNHQYASGVLSYLPERQTIWDEYYKDRRKLLENTSPLGVIFQSKPLRIAYIILLALLLSYFIFRIKRKQRIIPIILPPKNTTLEFIEMVGRLYYFEQKHRDLAVKIVDYFLSDIRDKYRITTNQLDEEFIKKLGALSGVSENELNKLFKGVRYVYANTNINQNTLKNLESLIDNFNKNSLR